MTAEDYINSDKQPQVQNLATVTVNAIQSANDVTDFSIFNALNAITGSWGSSRSRDTEVAYIGKICYWRKIGSGTMTFAVPPNKLSQYFAQLLTETGSRGVLIPQGITQVSVSMPPNQAWQLTGMFTLLTKD
jgi:hypothetical protein